ncbi:hypothetical protein ACE38W_01905 [Chitinophaga sp. Hz27]|uniref:hypothetical protein n=1 Tax=Chitinophaga sp. Hz27 TaxID=3347169 RepID=UPI0035DBF98A
MHRKKAKILFLFFVLLLIGAISLARKAKIRFVFYKALSPSGFCNIPTTMTGAFFNAGYGVIVADTHITNRSLTASCATVTIYKYL